MTRHHLLITGRVQNVFYRDWMVEQAEALGIDGWVRNRSDGSVEAVVAGASEMVETIIARCREGSPASHVADVSVTIDERRRVRELREAPHRLILSYILAIWHRHRMTMAWYSAQTVLPASGWRASDERQSCRMTSL